MTEFGQELRRRRELQRLSRTQLSKRSGISESQISNLETRGAVPTRMTVVDLVTGLGHWDIDEALHLVGQSPLTEEERAHLPSPQVDRWSALQRCWPQLSVTQQAAVVALCSAIVNPQDPERDNAGTPMVAMEAEPGGAARGRAARWRRTKSSEC